MKNTSVCVCFHNSVYEHAINVENMTSFRFTFINSFDYALC